MKKCVLICFLIVIFTGFAFASVSYGSAGLGYHHFMEFNEYKEGMALDGISLVLKGENYFGEKGFYGIGYGFNFDVPLLNQTVYQTGRYKTKNYDFPLSVDVMFRGRLRFSKFWAISGGLGCSVFSWVHEVIAENQQSGYSIAKTHTNLFLAGTADIRGAYIMTNRLSLSLGAEAGYIFFGGKATKTVVTDKRGKRDPEKTNDFSDRVGCIVRPYLVATFAY